MEGFNAAFQAAWCHAAFHCVPRLKRSSASFAVKVGGARRYCGHHLPKIPQAGIGSATQGTGTFALARTHRKGTRLQERYGWLQ